MAKTGGTQTSIGIGIETTAGTPVAATHFPKWTEFSFQGIAEKEMLTSQRGVRSSSSDSMIRRKFSRGNLGIIPNGDIAPIFFYLALGSKSSGTIVDGTYTHTFTVQNANASMKTATVLAEDGAIVTERFANCVVNQLDLAVSDGYAKMTAQMLGGFPDTGTVTESYAKENEYAYHQMTVKFDTSLTAAASASATPLKAFNLTLNNNVLLDEAFLSGSNTPAAGGFVAGRFTATGSYSLHFSDTTELAKYKANTKNAAIVTFTGPVTGGGTTAESITIKLGRLILTGEPKVYNLDGLLILNQTFSVEYEATDKEVQVVIVNDTASYA
ncbi:MAG: phage tail tube protein [Planctomycetota bacterium]